MIDYLISVTHNLAVQHQRQPPQLWRSPSLSTQPTLQAPSCPPSPTRYTTSSTKIAQNFLFLQSAPSSFTSYSPQFCCSALSYTTLPRRPAAPCWSPREAAARPARDHGDQYDGVGPRTFLCNISFLSGQQTRWVREHPLEATYRLHLTVGMSELGLTRSLHQPPLAVRPSPLIATHGARSNSLTFSLYAHYIHPFCLK